MNPEENNPETPEVLKEKHPVFQVTPLSKYLAMFLFIILPFIGGWIGYTYAPEKVAETEKSVNPGDSQRAELESKAVALSPDIIRYIHKQNDPTDLSTDRNYFAFIAEDSSTLQLVYLPSNKAIRTVSQETLPFVTDPYQISTMTLLPNNFGNAIFIDYADGCECERQTEAVLFFEGEEIKILPLPHVGEFEWDIFASGKFRYRVAVYDETICSDKEMCLPYRTSEEWIEGDVRNATVVLETWDGSQFGLDYLGKKWTGKLDSEE